MWEAFKKWNLEVTACDLKSFNAMKNTSKAIEARIVKAIYRIDNMQVVVDSDLAEMYGVQTKVLNQAVKRNLERFPEDFMFQVSVKQWNEMKSESATGWGGRRTLPYVFTEQGIAMLSSVLKSATAVQINIMIMRAFVKLRQWSTNYEDLFKKIEDLKDDQNQQKEHITQIYRVIEELVRPKFSERKAIGFEKGTKAG